jgi:hypothetical protein
VGAVDAIVDIVGAAAALTHVGATVVCSPLPMTRGFVTAQHGVLPLPAPATLSVLADVPTYGIALDREIVTPTGAAIVATAAARFERWPAMAPCAVGYGAGTMSLADRPNLLRLVLGQPVVERATEATHVVLECNVDDMSGELVAHALDVLRREGAVDAWATANTMKKGRPGLMISALATRSAADHLGLVMLRETTSIGLRRSEVSRVERPREIVSVETAYGVIDLKVSGGAFGPPQIKPEFEHCRRAADAHNVPVREVLRAALVAFDEASRR